ncbi:UDP-4-amino-4-deoxy-L-arabinose formyltransferase/UDP-glucuronic acid dehydrogenase (UDP-4-keto-hexauronic acid decarboxylating) [Kineothrix alysoides]|uniref:UDP-4-amino-4-deoxy-L-arabinose formyltransferase/UDP-glucuronic acid dehydrogenase (UDP-4-keto-hexauronic acid decarboxylating) n=1 Tax=Kineothrix alysoides TaxID=1469948 RepID=A0A4R1R229_9FIRM|nr:formyltransferase family protein [Kineothrix alysoides]TCL59423.1 UDP-4-amino-4-deoxy-L-arabinose formyltransferase/UDP-glucuronic acid dehydrogenase (UDP-4-keto-hexauronic acid decarboxylating) [Kineothrix alysoides]
MKYKVVVFGVKDTSENIVEFIQNNICPVDLVITIHKDVLGKNEVSGFKGLSVLTEKYQIPVFEAQSYFLTDEKTHGFMAENEFEIAISMGWQRLIPAYVLEKFEYGVYGFHGNCGYLPFGRGRSPLNWSMINGDTRFNLNLFRYDENADSPNVFATEMFSITPHDDIRTAQYKNMICSKSLIRKLLKAYSEKNIVIRTESRDFDSWYNKRTAADGKIDFHDRTRNIYNLIRGVAAPFPGAFAMCGERKVTIWEAHPFDEIIDFSAYAPGEVVDVFDGKPVVRTVDGSLLIERYECEKELMTGDVLE